ALASCGESSRIYVSLYDPSRDQGKEQASGVYERSDKFSKLNSYRNYAERPRESVPSSMGVKEKNAERRQTLFNQWGFSDEREGVGARIKDLTMLTANPYPYQGKTVVIEANFYKMTSPTDALFEYGRDAITLVTNVPSDLFRRQGTRYILAGR